jgi:hypothetical protein
MNPNHLDLRLIQERILREYTRPIVHIRQQLNAGRLGLVLGSGVSKPYGFPNWRQLISRIAKDHRVSGEEL